MLNAIAAKLSDSVIRQCQISNEKKNVYTYGFKLLISTGLGMLSVFLVSLLFRNPLSGVTFLLIFVSLRLYTGGYHASTYLKCFILTNSVFVITYLISKFLSDASPICKVITILISVMVILGLSPIQNVNHPLSEKRYARNKVIARFLSVFEAYSILTIYVITCNSYFLSISSASMLAVSLMMIEPKIKQIRRDNHE